MMDKKQNSLLKRYTNLLIDYLNPQKKHVAILSFLLITGIGLQLINPQIVRFFLDTAESGQGIEKLLGAASIFMGIAIVSQILQISATYLGEIVAWTATNMLRADLAYHCLNLDISFHKKYKPGELIERVDGDVNQLANFFSQLVVRLGSNLLLLLGVLFILWFQDWRIGVFTILITSAGLLGLNWLQKHTVPRWQALREIEAKLFGFLEEWLNGTEEIRTNGAEPFIMRRLYESMTDRWRKVMAAMRLQVLVTDIPLGVFALAYSAAHIIGNQLFQDGSMSVGQIYLIFYYLDLMREPLWEIRHQVEDLQKATASINRITELKQVQPTIHDGKEELFSKGPLGVTFKNVSFYYEDDMESDVLYQINFNLQPGVVLGLLGRTGSGKSTLTKLLYRFHDPTDGEVTLKDNNERQVDLRQVKKADIRRRIGLVTQEVQLFQATVHQNVTLFDDSISEEKVLKVIKDVGLGDWLQQLPGGLNTVLEPGGGNLSAGEAQLLAFARVFLADPGLVILDEASSRLDPVTERLIEKAMDKLLANRTAIIIAHRLNTIQRADEIMVLENGRIAEQGPRIDLADDPSSRFSAMLQTGLQVAIAK